MSRALKVLFASSGNKRDGISTIVFNQGQSIKKYNIGLDCYMVTGKGVQGYIKHLKPLSIAIKNGEYDVVHVHYSLCGFLVSLSAPLKPRVVVSLMGSFKKNSLKYYLIHFFAKYRWSHVIVKSQRMQDQINLKQSHIIPNGVQIDKFIKQPDRNYLRRELNFDPDKKYVIFVSNPDRAEKNFKLCRDSVAALDDPSVQLITVFNQPHEMVVKYLLAGDVLMLTSFSEGSPNVVKEAMAACCPIVATNVGDIKYLIGDLNGCYVLESFGVKESTEKLKQALKFGKRTLGLDKIISIGLSADEVAKRIIKLYYNC